jgi:hypothetical protein
VSIAGLSLSIGVHLVRSEAQRQHRAEITSTALLIRYHPIELQFRSGRSCVKVPSSDSDVEQFHFE